MLFSIVIPLYNKEGQIANTLRSVFAQTCTDYEIVIVNDGSTDGSAAAVEAIGDPRIRLIHQQNAGVSAARNRGIAEARGQYIALLDADDEWKPNLLETLLNLKKKYPTCQICAGNYTHVDITGKKSPTIINNLDFDGEDGILSNYFQIAAISNPPIWSSCVMTTKDIFDAVGGFPEGIKSGEDLLTWARIACRFKIAYTKKSLALYNMGEGYDFSKKPPRNQDKNDPVGAGLIELLNTYNPSGLKEYISLWHKMRASVAIRYGYKKETMYESFQALKYNKKNYKVWAFILLCFIPKSMRNKFISLRNHF
jgi:glycosyltransferase involved in cell wall biosynthesis